MADFGDIQGIPDPWRAGRNSSGGTISFITTNDGESVLKRALSKIKPDQGGEAHTRFGKASRFTLTSPDQKTQPSVTIIWPDDNNKNDEPKEIHISEYDWVSRCWETIRVENPDDSEQYVMVKNIYRIVFQGRDDGRFIALNLPRAADDKK
ncbi:hypothetical protein [Mesorhizobium sp. M2A.F.Ca.ET.067.02.1.1]|uniref:hypothetical protein n=1 Tax=Mesorhizobium sp. M2A.F.Ca.ET.067.02.1.1 TaxID=2496749 RepID=UPI000FD266C6|nr:hypothetical protein [Mesorhizobium sp. M2A.F.Ca.ET.067.02.1.1]RUW79622.1 hypothetical protein EOA28_07445 [Mesorhizobium sp. M2A.F.Ca.ET.067.02.1.1]